MNAEQKAESEGQIVALFQSACHVIGSEDDIFITDGGSKKSSRMPSPVDGAGSPRLSEINQINRPISPGLESVGSVGSARRERPQY